MNSLIAGGAGFIGSHLCQQLINRGDTVFIIDNLTTGRKSHLDGMKFEKFYHLDICDLHNFDEPLDCIYNLACPASPKDFEPMALQIHRACSLGHENLLKLALKKDAKILLASSSEVYGDASVHPQKEDYRGNVNCIGIRSCYDVGKRYAESITMSYIRLFSVKARVARIFNTYGPRMRKDDGRIIPNFVVQALNKQPLSIYGDGTQTRSFTEISELCEGLYRLMHSEETLPVNLGSTEEHTILAVANTINTLTDNTAGLSFSPLPEDDPLKRRPDIRRAEEILAWKPKISLEEGLKKVIQHYSQ